MGLPEDVEPDGDDDDDGDVQADGGRLEREREEEHDDAEERRGPGHESVYRAPDERRHRHADDAHHAEQPDHDAAERSFSNFKCSSLGVVFSLSGEGDERERTWSNCTAARRGGTSA